MTIIPILVFNANPLWMDQYNYNSFKKKNHYLSKVTAEESFVFPIRNN